MPNCRHCGSRLSRFDKDLCPVCGCKHPFEGVNQDTLDITQEIKTIDPKEVGGYERKKRKTCLLYSLLGGWFGLPFYYLEFKNYGLIYMFSMLLVNAVLFMLIFFVGELAIWIPIVIVIGIYLLADTTLGLYLYSKQDLKDGRGEYLE